MRRVLAGLVILGIALGCSNDGGTGPTPQLTTLAVTADRTALIVEETATLSVTGKDQNGNAITLPSQPAYTVSPGNVASVTGNVLTALSKGTATVTATVSGVSGTVSVTVGGVIHDADITANETWRAADNPHIVTADIAVRGSGTPILTLEAGVEVRFASGTGLFIGRGAGGALQALGTASAPITLKSRAAAPTKGAWRGVVIEQLAAASTLRHVTFNHCGGTSGVGQNACLVVFGSGNAGPRPVIEDVTVQNSGAYGVVVAYDAAFGAGSARLTVTGSTQHAIRIEANEAGTLPTGGTLTGNTPNAIQIVGEDVKVSQTWPNLGVPYAVLDDLEVEWTGGPVLTLPAGTQLRFSAGASLTVGDAAAGGLVVQGTALQPVVFTADAAMPVKGHWDGIFLGDLTTAGTSVSHAIIEYCGGSGGLYDNACLVLEGGGADRSFLLTNVTIRQSAAYGMRAHRGARLGTGSGPLTVTANTKAPVRIDANEAGSLVAGSYTGNTDDVIELDGDDVTATATWKNLGVPYRVLDDVEVEGLGAPVLTLEPGVTLRFTSGTSLWAGWVAPGDLVAVGTAQQPITMTAATNASGGWSGVKVGQLATAVSSLNHVIVDFGGGQGRLGGEYGNVVIDRNGLTGLIRNTIVRSSAACGVVRLWPATGNDTDYTDAGLNNTFANNANGDQCGPT